MSLPNREDTLAILGHAPEYDRVVPVGQLYFPSWDRYEAAMAGIFDRQYYTNNGPLHEALEEKLKEFFGVKHVICVLNATLGLMMVADTLSLKGKVLVPAFTFPATIQALLWAGAEPVLCDVDMESHHISPSVAERYMKEGDVEGILAVNLWGGACNVEALEALAEKYNVKLFFDSAQATGCRIGNQRVGNFGLAEVFSFHATKILSATEGGCICTNDSDLARKLRAMRPSYYGQNDTIAIDRVANARMSEFQAAIALMSLDDFTMNRNNNAILYRSYQEGLDDIDGISLMLHHGVDETNYQYAVCQVEETVFGLSRDELVLVLHAENILARKYFAPGLHHTVSYESKLGLYKNKLPNTDALNRVCIQLPLGAMVTTNDIIMICKKIRTAHELASKIKQELIKTT